MEVYDELEKALKEIEELKAEIKELNDDNVWWTNRFNAVERDNRELKQEIERLTNIINEVREFAINNTVRGLYELLDKENK